MQAPERGTPLYQVNHENGTLEIVTFLEESIVEGAYAPTWLLRNVTRKPLMGRFRTSPKNGYRLTPREAWADYIKDLQDSVLVNQQMIREGRETVLSLRQEIRVARERMKRSGKRSKTAQDRDADGDKAGPKA